MRREIESELQLRFTAEFVAHWSAGILPAFGSGLPLI
jgi:hypothetical protein